MQATVRGHNVEVTDALREYVLKKLRHFDRFFDGVPEATVSLTVEKAVNKIQVTIPRAGFIIRAEESDKDMYAAIDKVVDKLDRQVERFKSRYEHRRNVNDKAAATAEGELHVEEDEFRVVRTKRFAMKPMHTDEALMQMNMLGHDFFVFRSADTEAINVVYRRKDGAYGLIEPEE
jgi:putative sigma-54 modulation protein